jgi:hypothetical protein
MGFIATCLKIMLPASLAVPFNLPMDRATAAAHCPNDGNGLYVAAILDLFVAVAMSKGTSPMDALPCS